MDITQMECLATEETQWSVVFYAMLQGAVGCTCGGSRSIMIGATYPFFRLLACGIFPTVYSREHPEHHNHLVYACWWNYCSVLVCWHFGGLFSMVQGPMFFQPPKNFIVNPMNINIRTYIHMKIYIILVYTFIYAYTIRYRYFFHSTLSVEIGSTVRQFDWPRKSRVLAAKDGPAR